MLAPTQAVPTHSSLPDRQRFRPRLPPASPPKTQARASLFLKALMQSWVVALLAYRRLA